MKAKELKAYLSLVDDEDDIKLHIGCTNAPLDSIQFFGGECIYLCGHNYGCDDDNITMANMAKYLSEKK